MNRTTRLRHLLSVLLLPFNMALVVPALLWWKREWAFPVTPLPGGWLWQAVGVVLLGFGLRWFLVSLGRFAGDGDGTLAPWDPPRRLVVTGPYRYVRNPMITGVTFVLFGEAALLLSPPHLLWAVAFTALNALFIPLYEEPQLRRRFGAAYEQYCAAVPRLIPRRTPWQPPTGGAE